MGIRHVPGLFWALLQSMKDRHLQSSFGLMPLGPEQNLAISVAVVGSYPLRLGLSLFVLTHQPQPTLQLLPLISPSVFGSPQLHNHLCGPSLI